MPGEPFEEARHQSRIAGGRERCRETRRAGALDDALVWRKGRQFSEQSTSPRVQRVEQILEPLARRERQRMCTPCLERFDQPRGARFRRSAPIACDVVNRRTSLRQFVSQQLAATLAAKDHDTPALDLRQGGKRQQAFGVERLGRHLRVRAPKGRERLGRSSTRREHVETLWPARRRAELHRVRRHEDRDIVSIEMRVDLVERASIRGRQDDDRGPDERCGTKRGEFLREMRSLARWPRDDHADTCERTRARRHRAPKRPVSPIRR